MASSVKRPLRASAGETRFTLGRPTLATRRCYARPEVAAAGLLVGESGTVPQGLRWRRSVDLEGLVRMMVGVEIAEGEDRNRTPSVIALSKCRDSGRFRPIEVLAPDDWRWPRQEMLRGSRRLDLKSTTGHTWQ
jgi:hypothetical protein